MNTQAVSGSIGSPQVLLKVLSRALCFLTLILIFMGALVTSNNAGLAVPDWPTSFGHNMFTFPPDLWLGGIFYEHTHRLMASLIGLLTLLLTAALLRYESRRWLKTLGLVSLLLVCIQGTLGGLTVLMQLPAFISVLHGVIGQAFFVLTIIMAYSLTGQVPTDRAACHLPAQQDVFKGALLCLGLLYVQLILGAIMRHSESGLAVLDFPTMAGSWLPSLGAETLASINAERKAMHLAPVDSMQVLSHLAHRFMGVLVAGALLAFALRFRHQAKYITALVLVQFTLGIITVLSVRNPIITSLHVLFGALLLGAVVLVALRAYTDRKGVVS